MEWVSLEIGERRPFWGATSILGEGFLSQNNILQVTHSSKADEK
jgi:hypothetical protein